MKRALIAVALALFVGVGVVALAQSTQPPTTAPALFRLPHLDEPPNVDPSVANFFSGSVFIHRNCGLRITYNGQTFAGCSATQEQVETARQSAVTEAGANASSALASESAARVAGDAANSSSVSSLSSRVSALESGAATASSVTALAGRVSALEAVDYETQAEADAAHATLTASVSSNTSNLASLSSQVATLATASSVTALTTRVSTLEANSVTTTALNTALAGLQKRACGTATVTGLSVPLAGISSETTITIPNVPVGTSCDSGSASFMPLGARPDAIVTTVGTVRLRFVSNGGLLSSTIAIPSGTYRVCCDL